MAEQILAQIHTAEQQADTIRTQAHQTAAQLLQESSAQTHSQAEQIIQEAQQEASSIIAAAEKEAKKIKCTAAENDAQKQKQLRSELSPLLEKAAAAVIAAIQA